MKKIKNYFVQKCKLTKNIYRNSKTILRTHLVFILGLGALFLLSLFISIVMIYPNLVSLSQYFRQSMVMNVKNPTNYYILSIGFVVLALGYGVSNILINSSLLIPSKSLKESSKQYSTSWTLMILFEYLVLILYLFLIYLVNLVLSLIHFTWVDHQILVYTIFNLILFVLGIFVINYLKLLLPVMIKDIIGFKQTLQKTWIIYRKNWLTMILLAIRFIGLDLLVFFTGYFALIGVYPKKLAAYIALVESEER